MLVIEFFEEFTERIGGFGGGSGDVDAGEFFDEFGDIVGDAGESGVGEVIDAVVEAVAFDLFVDGVGAFFVVEMEVHLRGVKTGFAFDEIAEFGILDNHFGPKWIAGEAEEKSAFICGGFDDDVGPTRDDVFGF